MIKVFKGLTLQSTINDYAYSNSEEDDSESDPNSNLNVATHTSDGKKIKISDTGTTNRKSQHKLLINRLIPYIIPVVIPPIDQTNADGVAASGGTLNKRCTIL